MSDSGWTDDELCATWFKKVFIPYATARNVDNKPILLISDGHASHETPEMRSLAYNHNILLYCLPPHTTHKLQPLDVGVFGPLQTAWSKHCQERAATRNSITRNTVVSEYMTVRERYMTPKPVEAAFRHTGIWPYNPSIFTAADFGPSQATSTQMQTPSTYPTRIPSSPLSAQTTDASDMDWEEACEFDGSEEGTDGDDDGAAANEEAEEEGSGMFTEDNAETEGERGKGRRVSVAPLRRLIFLTLIHSVST